MTNFVNKSFNTISVSGEILANVVRAVKEAKNAAQRSGKVQTIDILRRGMRQDIVVGKLMVIPPSIMDSPKDIPSPILKGAALQLLAADDLQEFEANRLGESEFDTDVMDKKVLAEFKDKVFNVDGVATPVIVFLPAWSNPRDYFYFHWNKDEEKMTNAVRHLVFQAYYDPSLSNAFEELISTPDKIDVCHNNFGVAHLFTPTEESSAYPELVKAASTQPKRGRIVFAAATLDKVHSELTDFQNDEESVLSEVKKKIEDKLTLASAKNAAGALPNIVQQYHMMKDRDIESLHRAYKILTGEHSKSNDKEDLIFDILSEMGYSDDEMEQVVEELGKFADYSETGLRDRMDYGEPGSVENPVAASEADPYDDDPYEIDPYNKTSAPLNEAEFGKTEHEELMEKIKQGDDDSYHSEEMEVNQSEIYPAIKYLEDFLNVKFKYGAVLDMNGGFHGGVNGDEIGVYEAHPNYVTIYFNADIFCEAFVDALDSEPGLIKYTYDLDEHYNTVTIRLPREQRVEEDEVEEVKEPVPGVPTPPYSPEDKHILHNLGIKGNKQAVFTKISPEDILRYLTSKVTRMDYFETPMSQPKEGGLSMDDSVVGRWGVYGSRMWMEFGNKELYNEVKLELSEWKDLPQGNVETDTGDLVILVNLGFEAPEKEAPLPELTDEDKKYMKKHWNMLGKRAKHPDTNEFCHNPSCGKLVDPKTVVMFRGATYCNNECVQAHQDYEDKSDAKEAAGEKFVIVNENGMELDDKVNWSDRGKQFDSEEDAENWISIYVPDELIDLIKVVPLSQKKYDNSAWEREWSEIYEKMSAAKAAGFTFFVPGQVTKELYPEIYNDMLRYPSQSYSPMPEGTPGAEGTSGNELSSPAGMGIRPSVLTDPSPTPLRQEMNLRGPGYMWDFYKSFADIPGDRLNFRMSSKKRAFSEPKQILSELLKGVCGEIAASIVAGYKVTKKPNFVDIPGEGTVNFSGGGDTEVSLFFDPLDLRMAASRLRYVLSKLNDGEIQDVINSSWAQAAVWNTESFKFEALVRIESIDTDSLEIKYKFITSGS